MKTTIKFIIFMVVWTLGMFVIMQKLDAYDLYTYGGLSYEYTKINQYCDPEEDWFVANIASGIEQDLSFLTFFAEAELETEMFFSGESIEDPNWSPTHQDYYVRGGVTAGAFQIGYEHLCEHNVDRINMKRNGGHDAVYVRFDSRGF